MSRRYWAMRTHFDRRRDAILPALDSGELRQGWGSSEDEDLDVIGRVINTRGRAALTDDQEETWRGNQRLWPGHPDPVTPGDVIVAPKLPEASQLTIVEVTGSYRYSPDPAFNDYGHIIPVKVLRRGVPYSNRYVGAGLRRSLRTPGRFWSLDHQADAIEALLAHPESETGSRDSEVEKLRDILEETTEALRRRLWEAFQGNQLEAPVERLLVAIYQNDSVEKKAGPREQGADYLIESTDPFGHTRRTVVQLKAWEHEAHDPHALHQLEQAVGHYAPVDEALLLTTADGETEDFAASREALVERLACPVRFVDGATLAALFLAHLPDIASK